MSQLSLNVNKKGRNTARNRPSGSIANLRNVGSTVTTIGSAGTGLVQHISPVAQGTDFDERVGDKISLARLWVRGTLIANTADTSTLDTICRIIVFRDNFNQGTAPAITDFLTFDGVGSLRNTRPENLRRYEFLADNTFVVGNDANSTSGISNAKLISYEVSLGNRPCTFIGTAATDEGPGSLWIYHACSKSTNLPTVSWNFRTFYRNA